LAGAEQWKGLQTIGVVVSISQREGKTTSEARYFLSSLPRGVKQWAHAIRSHGGIENSCRWSLDITYREDESRIREERRRENCNC
jgi:predicted transposase YbfD/YdcC